MNKFRFLIVCIGSIGSLCVTASAQAQQVQSYEITQVTQELYRAANNTHRTVFLVTDEGIILADPINTEFSSWLKSELDERFDVPVRYVLYTHHHGDHASGGAVFSDTALFVGHEAMAAELASPLPSNSIGQDSNGDGRLARSEATGGALNNFDLIDTNGDDYLTGREINSEIQPPGITFSDRMTVALGGQSVELVYVGPAHSDDMSVLYFPEQSVGFGVDYINVRRLPGALRGYPIDQYKSGVEAVLELDAEIFVPGHGDVGSKRDIADYLGFLRDLESEVSAAIANGLSVEETQDVVRLSKYSDWLSFDDRRPNLVADAYSVLTSAL